MTEAGLTTAGFNSRPMLQSRRNSALEGVEHVRFPQIGFVYRMREDSLAQKMLIAPDRSFFCVGQCRKGDGSGGGTIFDAELAQDSFDVLADRPGASLKTDLISPTAGRRAYPY